MDVSDDDFVEEEGSPNREQDDITTAEAGVDFVARSYQLEIFEKAKSQNVIAYLDTAAGKTYISVLLVKHLWDRWRHRNPAPLTIFIVPTVILVEQQALVFKQHTPLRVGLYHGARSNIDFWDQGRWEREFGSHDILVMTAQILLDMLIHGFVSMERLGLLIFDECHMAAPRRRGKSKSKVSNHPYCQIMLEFYHAAPLDARPRVFGMTASPSKGFQDTKETPDHESLDSQIAQHFRELEHVLDAKIHTMSDREELERHVPAPKVETVLHAAEGQQGLALTDRALHLMDRASSRMAWRQRYERAVNGLRRLEQGKVHELVLDTPKLKTSAGQLRKLIMHVLALFQEMGPWCAAAVVETVLSGEDASEGVIEALDLQSGIKLKKGAVDAEGCRSVEEVQQVVLQAVAEQEISREILDDMRQPHIAGLRAIRDLLVAFTTVLVPEAAAPQLLAEIDGTTVRKAAVDPRLLERDLRRLMAQIMAFTPEDELRKLVTGHKDAVLSPAGVPLVTNKVAALMGVLFRERARMAAGGSAGGEAGATRRLWCCLVFCKMRITAMALHVLLSHRSLQAEMDHLSSDYLVGQQGGEEATGMMRHSIARQQTVVERLRLGQLNCVFATNVAEQGLDIRQCQLVVAYDLPSSSGELIQQRGRARVKCARYVCLISMREQGRDSKKLHLLNYVIDSGIRQALATSTVQRPPELAVTLAPAKAGTYKTPAGAKISMHAAKQLLNQYCVLLDSDPHTCLQPMFSTRRTAEEPPLYQSRLVMPPTCPLRRCKGEFMPTAAEAKSSACLAAVRKLHQLGELDDQLVPACRDVRDNESVERDKQVLQLPEEELRRMRPQEMWSWIGGGKIPNAMIQRKHPLLLMPPGPQQESCAPPMPFASPAARQALAPAPQHRARSKKQHKLWLYAFATQLKGASNATGTGPDGPGGPAAAQVLPLGMLTQRRLPPEAGASFTIWPRPSAGACAEDLDAAMEKQTARMLECRELPLSAADVARLQHYHRVLLAILYGARRNTMMASAAAAKLVRLRLRYTPASEPGAAATVSVRLHVRQSMCEMWDLLERHRKSVAAVPTSSSKKQCDEDLHASVALSPVPEGAMRVVPEEEWCKSSCGCWYLLVPVAPAAEAAADVDWRQVQMTEAGAGPMVDLVNMQECQRLWKVGTGTMSAGAQRQVEKQRHQLLSSFDEQLQDRVVLTTHGDQVRVYRYAGMCESITLESTFLRREAGALREVTYQDYFRGRYGMTHLKPRQPLVGLVHHHHRVCGYNLLNPPSHTSNRLAQRKEQSSSQSSHRRRIQMPVELCLVHPIPSSVWASLRYIPCFLYRMESLLLAHQLTEALAPPWTTQRPPVQEVLEAITAPVARETFDMEAYETLGDTYLKYGVVAYLFMRHPAARESSLSPAKHKIVSNGSLFNLCRRWGIHHYIRAWPFHFSTWYPPGLDESPPPVLRVVQGKVLADVVEAVIGVWFELLGLKQGLQFLQHLQVLPPGDCLDWSGSQADWEYISQAEFRRYLDQEGRSRAQPLLNIQDDIQMPESKEELLQVLVSGSVRRKSAARPVQRAGDGTGSSSSEDADSLPGAPGGGAGVGRAVEQRKRSILEQFRDETLLLHPASTTAALWPGGAPVPCGAPAAAGAPLAGQRAGVGAGGPQQQQQQQQQEGGARSKALRAETAVQAAAAAGLVATTRRSLESCGGGQATDRWMQGVESRLDYVFRYPFLARSAFTHASWVRPNPPSYQRLEFLGDAVMEVLLTQWLFHRYRGSHPDFGPDLLTNMRCLMVNNDRLARCTLLRGLHRFLNEHSVSIRRGVNRFRDSFFANLWKLEQQGPEASRAETRKLALAACGYRSAAAAERAPKVLGDLVESSVGAVFLDSDQDVQETRRVVLQLMAPLIDAKDCPMHPVKRLLIQLNKQGIQPRFEAVDMEGQQPGRYTVVLMVGSQRLCRPCTSDSARHARIVAAQTVLELMRQSPDYVHEVLLNDRAPGGGPAAASSGSSGGGQGAEEGSASDVQMADLEGGAPLLFTHGEAWEGSKRRKLAAPRLAGGEEGITLAAAEDSDSSGAGRDADWQYSVPVRRGAATDVINQLRAFAEGDAYRRGMDSLQAADAPPLNQVNAFTDAINGVMPY